jgi:preprotein translocase subunit YajC
VNYLPIIIFLVVAVGLLAFSARARRRQADAETQRRETIQIGTEVMTTSGLYGTVVARNDDDTVVLSIAPGVEVKWAFAALRDVASLPAQYRQDDGETARFRPGRGNPATGADPAV